MEKDGLIKKEKKEGKKHLEKHVYSITDKGRREFLKMAIENLSYVPRPFISLDVSLYFLPYLDKEKVIHSLRLRTKLLEKVQSWLKERMSSLRTAQQRHLKMLLEHHVALCETEFNFTKGIIEHIEE